MTGCLILTLCTGKAISQAYFQQQTDYNISVTLNDRKHELSAYESVRYKNNSPDTLTFIYFHLWPNGYSSNKTELAKQLFLTKGKQRLFKNPVLAGYIDSLNFSLDGKEAAWDYLPGQPDICKVELNKKLSPGDSVLITTPFHVKIPLGVTSRLGHIGESYQVSQWYPKPAVYDKNGWHQMPYLDQGEFYSEFGSFDVSITLPANYIVGASGDLVSPQEVAFQQAISRDTIWKIAAGYLSDRFPRSTVQLKTIRYKGSKIHDFAWFADKRFHVMMGHVKLPSSGREITTLVMCTNQQAVLWKDALPYVNNAVLYFSKLIGDYPYNNVTVVQSALNAGSGMEYPGITVIGEADNSYSLEEVIAHEICHNWFYSSLGSDERRFPFMDESITSAYEERYMLMRYPDKKMWEIYLGRPKLAKFLQIDRIPVQTVRDLEWMVPARLGTDQPANLAAPDYTEANYSATIYSRGGMGFGYLRASLSDSLFDSVMHDYFLTWQGKHPQPEDLKALFELNTGKDLSWFFNDFICTTKRLDYKVLRLHDNRLLVRNTGELASPLAIAGLKDDTVVFKNWYPGFKGREWIDLPAVGYSEIRIDPLNQMPEINRLNNNVRKSGLFRKSDHLRAALLYTIDDPSTRTVVFFPAVNWTHEDGFMVGLNVHNTVTLPKPVEFSLTPFYKVKDTDLAGDGRIAFNFFPYDKLIRMASVSLEGTQYGSPGLQNYLRTKAGIDLFFRNDNGNNVLNHSLSGSMIMASDLFQIEQRSELVSKFFTKLGYKAEFISPVNPYSFQALLESGKTYKKASLETNYRISYYGPDSGLDFRIFTGLMLKTDPRISFYSFSAGGRDGKEQYLFDGTFYDRFNESSKSVWSRQMTLAEGGITSPLTDTLGFSRWLVSVTITSSIPIFDGKLPVKPFVNILLNDHGLNNGHGSPLFFEAGIKAGIWRIFEIYFPLVVSGNIASVDPGIRDRIRFVLNIDELTNIKLNWQVHY